MTSHFQPFVDSFEPISLEAMNAKAALLDRSEKKYLFTLEEFLPLADELGRQFNILEISGQRSFRYKSLYFDTDDLVGYTFHNQGRTKRRFKVRTRQYVDSGLCFFEVKLKDKRGGTIKKRIPYPLDQYDVLTKEAQAFLNDCYRQTYGLRFTHAIKPKLHVNYQRITLVAKTGSERMTIDFNLRFADGERHSSIKPMIIVETKSPTGKGLADAIFRQQAIRSRSCSKYCLGANVLELGVKYNRFKQLLKHYNSLPVYFEQPTVVKPPRRTKPSSAYKSGQLMDIRPPKLHHALAAA